MKKLIAYIYQVFPFWHPVLPQISVRQVKIAVRQVKISKLTKPPDFSSEFLLEQHHFCTACHFFTLFYLKLFFHWAAMTLHSLVLTILFSLSLLWVSSMDISYSSGPHLCFKSNFQVYIFSPYWASHSYMWMQKLPTEKPFSLVPWVPHV